MAVVVYVESENGTPKKTGLEVTSYGRALADAQGVSLVAVGFNLTDHQRLNSYGVDKLYNIDRTVANLAGALDQIKNS